MEKRSEYSEAQRSAMRARVNELRDVLDELPNDAPIHNLVIDWGGSAKGQGKRSGGLVKGSMSSPLYKRHYSSVDLSEFAGDFGEDDWMTLNDGCRRYSYHRGRKYGLCHWEAMYYAVSHYYGKK